MSYKRKALRKAARKSYKGGVKSKSWGRRAVRKIKKIGYSSYKSKRKYRTKSFDRTPPRFKK